MSVEYIVLVKRPYTTVDPVRVNLKTTADFDGTGTVTRNRDNIDFSLSAGGPILKFDGKDNKFEGAKLSAGVDLFAVAKKPSATMKDVELTLTLSGGSKKNGPPAKIQLTAVELTVDICEPRVNDTTEPQPLPTATSAPAACSGARVRVACASITVIASGANLDDLSDFRPGLKAAAERSAALCRVSSGSCVVP